MLCFVCVELTKGRATMKDWKKESQKILKIYQTDLLQRVYEKARDNLEEILLHEEVPPELVSHCYVRIFPMIALYRAIKEQDPSNAYKQISELFWKKQVFPGAMWMQRLLKIPGLYKFIPRLTVWAVKKKYKASSEGFQYDFLETSPSRVRLTFHQCPYSKYCLKYEVPELCDVFCTSDEIAAQSMLPYIHFNRSQTIGRGGNYCDFSYEINPQFQCRRKGNYDNKSD